jgi:membrane protein
VQRAKALLDWWNHTRPARANARFGAKAGSLLTGGIAYATLFSVIAALTIGFTVFMAVLGKNEGVRDSVVDAVSESLPGLIKSDAHPDGLIDPTTLQLHAGLTIASIVAVVVLVLSAVSATAALQTAVRQMFTDEPRGDNAVLGKLRQLGGFGAFAAAILVSALLTTAVGSVAQWTLDALHWDSGTTFVLRVVGALVAFLVDAATFVLIVRLLAGQRPPWRDQLWGAAIAGIGIGVVRWLGTSVVAGSATKNAVFASFVVILTLLVWVNLLARIVLLAAAWTANPPYRGGPPPVDEQAAPAESPESGQARVALS